MKLNRRRRNFERDLDLDLDLEEEVEETYVCTRVDIVRNHFCFFLEGRLFLRILVADGPPAKTSLLVLVPVLVPVLTLGSAAGAFLISMPTMLISHPYDA